MNLFHLFTLKGCDLNFMYTGHKQELAKMDCALTPSDALVVSGSEDGKGIVPSVLSLMFAMMLVSISQACY
jgi:hypothetical protein